MDPLPIQDVAVEERQEPGRERLVINFQFNNVNLGRNHDQISRIIRKLLSLSPPMLNIVERAMMMSIYSREYRRVGQPWLTRSVKKFPKKPPPFDALKRNMINAINYDPRR